MVADALFGRAFVFVRGGERMGRAFESARGGGAIERDFR